MAAEAKGVPVEARVGARIEVGEAIEAGEVHGLLYPRSATVEWRQADERVIICEHHVGKFYRLAPIALAAAQSSLREVIAAEVINDAANWLESKASGYTRQTPHLAAGRDIIAQLRLYRPTSSARAAEAAK